MERLLDEHIEKLKSRVIKMCSLVDEQVQSAIKAVEEDDIELAKQVIEKDNIVDKYDNKIDKICQKIFALTQPVAFDLRLIMSSLTINNNLERIGDIAVNIAEYLTMIEKKPAFFNQTKLDPMFKIAKQILKDAIDSYIQGNENLAKSVITSDDALDKLNVDNHSGHAAATHGRDLPDLAGRDLWLDRAWQSRVSTPRVRIRLGHTMPLLNLLPPCMQGSGGCERSQIVWSRT